MTKIDLCIAGESARARDVVDAAVAAEQAGFAAVAFADQLGAAFVGPDAWNQECWTMMAAAAARTERVDIGSMVLNYANRDAGTTAVAAASLQDLSGGRLWLGIGSGTGRRSPFAREQFSLGRTPPPDPQRRAGTAAWIAGLRRVWSLEGHGLLRPEPLPPLIVGAFGPKTAALAGRVADGVACPLDGFGDHARPLEELVEVARAAFTEAGRTGGFRVVAHTGPHEPVDDPRWDPGAPVWDRLAKLGAERIVLFAPPSAQEITKLGKRLLG
ncbi:LLM class flavin-dependent oxidoreductase [Actinomadura graeca]|uniref:LLM class flavin-dependent oxidoreductase n=1 Tax=Actinomadura graeca TaxID=2750812 RepID=A0ABX8QV26_9ACTN|nr:LLM class flavin-dependent oxidoreductase [Actinomadura graeca]QXJ22592.1 LLM class flavin-dependent oxidoreductase [Actinomadura graeca]